MKYIPLEKSINELLQRHGPYLFDDRLLDDLIELFSRLPDPGSAPDQSYLDAPTSHRTQGFWAGLKRHVFG